ncbi:hypothetical protein [Flavobacterium sp.]|uniref:hypothetical protein n=1 Tax=Flavobacterium sp. TaxID=239 RepID=UPI00286D0828|nr:hypothetical protein [Flavobacterium sp.]
MRKVVMLLAVLLGTSFMVNANTITKKANTSKEVVVRKKHHRKVKNATSKNTEAAAPTAKVQK